jgi:[ribosomal protein S18]-alanine N-acetyltransferase
VRCKSGPAPQQVSLDENIKTPWREVAERLATSRGIVAIGVFPSRQARLRIRRHVPLVKAGTECSTDPTSGEDMATIRNAREDEADILAEVGFRSWEKAMMSIGEMTDMSVSARSAFLNFTRSSWLTITVVDRGGTIVGWAAREKLDELISDFWIDPHHQGHGFGRALLAEIEAEIVHQGFETARVETHARNNEAVGFFEKHGYSINWLSITYSPKIDRDVQSVGLSKQLVADEPGTYGPGF